MLSEIEKYVSFRDTRVTLPLKTIYGHRSRELKFGMGEVPGVAFSKVKYPEYIDGKREVTRSTLSIADYSPSGVIADIVGSEYIISFRTDL